MQFGEKRREAENKEDKEEKGKERQGEDRRMRHEGYHKKGNNFRREGKGKVKKIPGRKGATKEGRKEEERRDGIMDAERIQESKESEKKKKGNGKKERKREREQRKTIFQSLKQRKEVGRERERRIQERKKERREEG